MCKLGDEFNANNDNKECTLVREFVGRLYTGLRRDYRLYKLGAIPQKRLKIEVKLLLSANRKSYMPRRLAQRMTLSDLEWLHRALSLR